jgi:hypothetical protein
MCETLSAVLLTSTGSAGLGIADRLSVTGVFMLTTPTGPLYSGYGIEFNDATAGGTHQAALLQVRFNEVTGLAQTRYQFQDFDAGVTTGLGAVTLAPPPGADRTLPRISRPDIATDDFWASFQYLAGTDVLGGGSFETPASLFDGESFVRARSFVAVAAAVPGPGMAVLWALGLGLQAAARAPSRAAGRPGGRAAS